MHVPAVTSVTVEPDTVQVCAVIAEKDTGRPELAVAVRATAPLPRTREPGLVNEIDCAAGGGGVTAKLCTTDVAGMKFALPAWLAVMEHWPAASSVTVEPLTVQIAPVVEAYVTARPEVAVADRITGVPSTRAPGLAKEIVWAGVGDVTAKLCTTPGAISNSAVPS